MSYLTCMDQDVVSCTVVSPGGDSIFVRTAWFPTRLLLYDGDLIANESRLAAQMALYEPVAE